MNSRYGRNESNDIIEELNSLKVDRQKDAVKKVISAMTIGRDVGKLFPQVVKCIATTDIELKKLVYLYIINYARYRPIETLLAVNTFKKDASKKDTSKKDASSQIDTHPLTRALAVRTMGCLGVEQIMQFLCDPLKDALLDEDPYLRKTAALCVAKIYDINPQLVEEQFCFVDMLLKMIEEEGNAMVIANCLAALNEISITKGQDVIRMNWKKTRHLMNALHENNEWCQIYLLEGISKYNPQSQEERMEIIERVKPFVSHSNSGVVLAAIKILVKILDYIDSAEAIRGVCKKITPSLVTLLSAEPEIQYVALKNINVLIQKRPIIFEKDYKMFFCVFTEPIYNKMEKLEILYKLVTMNNIDIILNELKEYSTEVDVQFVRRVVKLIGQCAIKLEKAAERCVETLVELVKTQISFVIQEAIIALRDIFRRYPNTFEGAMAIVNENLRVLDDSEAKAALIWIIGEYADRIDGAEVQMTRFLDSLKEESYIVQLQLLNSAVKTFLKRSSEESYNILQQIFDFTKESDNPDLREKGFLYWRLLSIDPNLASLIVLSEKPRISEDVSSYEPSLLDLLMNNLGNLATIYAKPPDLFVKKTNKLNLGDEEEVEYEESPIQLEADNIPDKSNKRESSRSKSTKDVEEKNIKENIRKIDDSESIAVNNGNNLLDLNDILAGGNSSINNVNQKINSNVNNKINLDMLNLFDDNTGGNNIVDSFSTMSINSPQPLLVPKQIVWNENAVGFVNKNHGLVIEAALQRERTGALFLNLTLENRTSNPIQSFDLQFGRNYFGLTANPVSIRSLILSPGSSEDIKIEVLNGNPDPNKIPSYDPPCVLQTAIRCSLDEFYFSVPILFTTLFDPQSIKMSAEDFKRTWSEIQIPKDMKLGLQNINQKYQNLNSLISRFESNNIYMIERSDNDNGAITMLFYGVIPNSQQILIAANYNPINPSNIILIAKSESNYLISHVLHSLKFMLLNDC